ncbi:hypothetical protein BC829DRAFT_390500 [Chytridium lagenaria]|nr:hypothetical protein BC829DRAFT_390500 [Chytridium lagenaria]
MIFFLIFIITFCLRCGRCLLAFALERFFGNILLVRCLFASPSLPFLSLFSLESMT